MDENDIYHDAACLYAALLCNRCGSILDAKDIGTTYNSYRWDKLLGNAAREQGWLISEDASAHFGFKVLCPNCVRVN